MSNVLVIGAGVAGLSAAEYLTAAGHEVVGTELSEIAVGYKPMDGKPKEGKLTITCDEVDLPWVIYLAAT